MKTILFSVLAIAMIGVMVPSAFGEVFVNNEPYLFSIEYPSEWSPLRPNDFLENGVMIDRDGSGVNGLWIGIWQGAIEEEMADYKIMEILKADTKYFCETSNFEEHYNRCFNHRILDSEISTIDGFRAFTVFEKYTIEYNGKDPFFPDGTPGRFDSFGTATYVLSYDDVWLIFSSFEEEKFDKQLVIDTINSFKLQNIVQEEMKYDPPTQSSWIDDLINAIMSIFKW